MADENQVKLGPDPSLLLVDDDEIFVNRLARAMERRGFVPSQPRDTLQKTHLGSYGDDALYMEQQWGQALA